MGWVRRGDGDCASGGDSAKAWEARALDETLRASASGPKPAADNSLAMALAAREALEEASDTASRGAWTAWPWGRMADMEAEARAKASMAWAEKAGKPWLEAMDPMEPIASHRTSTGLDLAWHPRGDEALHTAGTANPPSAQRPLRSALAKASDMRHDSGAPLRATA